MSTAKLYTPQVLALATSLSGHPWDENLPLKGGARSKSCGSTITLALGTDDAGLVDRIGLKSQACAIGQAAAAIFAGAAIGRSGKEICEAGDEIQAWLAGNGERPDWPGLEAIEVARDYPGRHGAIMLAWQAARELLSSD
ncbi:MAG: iron-sulfur cluster assembly scaffold protein [Novosphingobium sp.]|nr:iron-sulfur cluster assembly scaffold protein [Novosphingobium sp.]